jgi:hypothetical protein
LTSFVCLLFILLPTPINPSLLFNGSSAFGAAGISFVYGIKVSGMNFQDNNGSNGQVTVSLSPDSSFVDNSTSSVIILLLRIPFNTENLMLLGTLRSEEQNINPFGLSTTIDPFGKGMMFPFLDRRGQQQETLLKALIP